MLPFGSLILNSVIAQHHKLFFAGRMVRQPGGGQRARGGTDCLQEGWWGGRGAASSFSYVLRGIGIFVVCPLLSLSLKQQGGGLLGFIFVFFFLIQQAGFCQLGY